MQFIPGNIEQSVGEPGSDRRVEFRKPATLTHRREDIDQVLTFIVTSAVCLHLVVDTISGEPLRHVVDGACRMLPADTKSSNRKRRTPRAQPTTNPSRLFGIAQHLQSEFQVERS